MPRLPVIPFVISLAAFWAEADAPFEQSAAAPPAVAGEQTPEGQETPKKKNGHSHPAHGKTEPAAKAGEKGFIPNQFGT